MGSILDTLRGLVPSAPASFDSRFSAATPYLQPPPRTDYPSQDDVNFARSVDMAYGRSGAGIDTPGQRVGVLPDMTAVKTAANDDDWSRAGRAPMTQSDRDREYAAWMAAQRSPVAALGLDQSNTYTTPTTDSTPRLTVGGFFNPANNKSWYDARQPSSEVHEATHRGMEILRQKGSEAVPGKTPIVPEEYWVRALMQRHFGDVEQGRGAAGDAQIVRGKRFGKDSSNLLNNAEAAAAAEINRRHPMGPN